MTRLVLVSTLLIAGLASLTSTNANAQGVGFAPWGWGSTRFEWGPQRLIVNNAPWGGRG